MSNQMQTYTIRYEMRNEIEHIIKEHNINRKNFHETAKSNYEKVIRNLYYNFCDYQKYPKIQIAYMWTRFRNSLNSTEIITTNWNDWETYINKIDNLIPEKNPTLSYYLIVDGGWVYEGILYEIKKVLLEYPFSMEDFYLFPKNFRWLITHCDDGACMCRVWK